MKAIITAIAILIGTSVNAQSTPSETYYNNGNIESRVASVNGADMITIFHEEGGVKETGIVENGKREGQWERYDAQGNLVARAYYKNDKKAGDWVFWNADGSLKMTVTYENNAVASYKDYSGTTVALGDE